MKTTNSRRWLRTGAAFVATVAMLAAGALSATPAHAATTVKQLSLTAAPAATSVRAFADVNVSISFTGCYVYGLELQEYSGGAWKALGDGYATGGKIVDLCSSPTSKATVSLASLLGYRYESQQTSLSIGTHTLRIAGRGWYEEMNTGEYWDIQDGVSNQFQVTVTKAQTSFSGWSARTITVKPGGSYTLPALSITNPGGYDNLVIAEVNEGFGWICLSSTCDSYSNKASSNAQLSSNARKMSSGKNWTLQLKFRYRVLPNAYVTGGVSPIITVNFTSGIAKSKVTRTALTVSGTQQYKKKQATLKATVNQKKATGVVGFLIYKKSKYGSYEQVYSPYTGPVLKKGKASYKFSKTVAKAGRYVVVANFQSKAPKKFRDSISKAVTFVVK